jgi:MoaA/NifB/PqqE/SkfB family radical SAM enzyme
MAFQTHASKKNTNSEAKTSTGHNFMIGIPASYNYIAVFLTMRCNLGCPYCINLNGFEKTRKDLIYDELSAEQWIEAINKLDIKANDLPVTLQGGEPTLHKGFYEIVNGVREDIKLDLLTNMTFDVNEFIKKVNPKRFTREAKYAAIRVSYHPGQNDIDDLVKKTLKMRDAGFYVGIYGILHPETKTHIEEVMSRCISLGIDFRVKEFLGYYKGKWYGNFKYKDAIAQKSRQYCECKTTELIIGPNGDVFRCHSDLYNKRNPLGNITTNGFAIYDTYRPCYNYGYCNPCDVKIKTNRYQEYGHTSVDIINIR